MPLIPFRRPAPRSRPIADRRAPGYTAKLLVGLTWSFIATSASAQSIGPNQSRPFTLTATTSTAPPANAASRTPIVRRPDEAAATVPRTRTSPWGSLAVLGGLLLGLYVVSRWLKQAHPARFARLSPAAIELLGSTPITPQSAMHVVRVGERLLVVGSGHDGLRTLTEVSDPAEIAHLTHLCRAEQTHRTSPWSLWSAFWPRRAQRPTADARTDASDPTAAAQEFRDIGTTLPDERRSRLSGHRVAGWWLLLTLCGSPLLAQSYTAPQPPIAVDAHGPPGFPATNSARAAATYSTPAPSNPAPLTPQRPGTSGILQTAYRPDQATDVIPTDHARETASNTLNPTSTLLNAASPQSLGGTLRLGLLIGVMSLAPAILLMTTSYIRFIVVFGLLRQAIGVQQFPPTQVLTALSLFLTGLVMWPTWSRCWSEGVAPYAAAGPAASPADLQLALTRTAAPMRTYMSRQIEASGNTDAIDLLMSYQAAGSDSETLPPAYYEEVPLPVLLPAYVLSELKTAFLIGFQIYLPFLVIDLVVSSLLTSLGLGTLSPAVVSLPFKLLLFVLIDGWFLVVELLLQGLPPVS